MEAACTGGICWYSQHEVLFPTWTVASDSDRRRLDILQFECDVRVKLVCNVTHFTLY